MRKRLGLSKEASRTLIRETGGGEGVGFFACYLLASLSPRHKSQTYIGFTVNPRRRIRQHNGEIASGAWRTKAKRPWEMALCIYGFPTNVAALQFEWAWQHPTESVAVRNAAASFKSFSGIANKIKLAYTMLTLPAWQGLNLTVNFFSTKYIKHSAGCPSLPEHMKVRVCPMDDLPCYEESNHSLWENENEENWHDDDEESERIGGEGGNMQEKLVHVTSHHAAAHKNSTENTFSESFGASEGNAACEPRESDYFRSSGSPRKATSCDPPGLYSSEGSAAEDVRDFQKSRRKPAQAAVDDQRPINSGIVPREVEVIDVSTPSPDCGISFCTKKRRASSAAHPRIIDLTRSPIFVQL